MVAARGLEPSAGAQAGFEVHESLLDLGESHGALGAAVPAGRRDGGRRGLLDELVDSLACALVHAGFGQQSGHAVKARFVAFFVAVCGTWRNVKRNRLELSDG